MKTINEFIHQQTSPLGKLLAKSDQLQQLQSVFDDWLEADYKHHARVANIRDGALVIEADNGAVATQLQYQQMEILSFLRQQGWPQLANVKVIVKVS